jgi:hypothetical protein
LPEFATALRELRRQAGSPPFRQLARRAHYSPTTLSVACSGTVLPSLEVTLSLVRACGGREEEWRQRWTDAAAMSDSAAMSDAAPGRSWPVARGAMDGRRAAGRRAVRRLLPQAAVSVVTGAAVLALAGLTGWFTPSDAAPQQQSAASSIGPAAMYVGVSLCDPARTRFSPAAAFLGQAGRLTLRSFSAPDNSENTSPRYTVFRYADGEPMLTVLGCVDAMATISFGHGGPTVTAVTNCFPESLTTAAAACRVCPVDCSICGRPQIMAEPATDGT